MKLIIPLFIILLGMLTGALVNAFFKEKASEFKWSLAAGGIGAFAGILIRDSMDASLGGNLLGTLLAAILGALVAAVITNLIFGQANNSR